jgi:hypothetical protein
VGPRPVRQDQGPPSVAEERRQRDLSVGSADRNGQLFVALRPRPSLMSSRAGKLRRDEDTRSAAHAVQLRPVAQGRRTRKARLRLVDGTANDQEVVTTATTACIRLGSRRGHHCYTTSVGVSIQVGLVGSLHHALPKAGLVP